MTMFRVTGKQMSADACTAPVCQSASMTAAYVCLLDTAVLAVSFLSVFLLDLVSVRKMQTAKANL